MVPGVLMALILCSNRDKYKKTCHIFICIFGAIWKEKTLKV